ncbi:MAG: hypothetical protein AMXMBFR84_21400 [Candidatus Hydrogenedentota bacterium]
MISLYQSPKYYDLAFSYRDVPAEVGVLEQCMRRFCALPVRSVAEWACGQAPYAAEIMNRGYAYTGLDLNPVMLEYARSRLTRGKAAWHLVEGNMIRFQLPEPVDFAYVLLASLYAQSTQELQSHYNSVAMALRPGGLYVLEWCVEFDPLTDVAESWEVEGDGISILATYYTRWQNHVEQILEETIRLDVSEDGQEFTIEDTFTRRVIFPQEFLEFIRNHTEFEFLGWWNNWDLDEPVDGLNPVSRPIVVLRRR